MPLTTLEALWNHQVTAYTRLVKFVVRIHAGEPHIVVRTLSARYSTAIYALTAVLVASGGFRRGLSVSAADSSDRRKSQLRHSRVELAESLPWRRQGSPLFHRSDSVDADGLCRDDCGCISNRSHHTGLRLGLLCRMPDMAKDFAEMAKTKLTMPVQVHRTHRNTGPGRLLLPQQHQQLRRTPVPTRKSRSTRSSSSRPKSASSSGTRQQ
jgi:hypothetical protein